MMDKKEVKRYSSLQRKQKNSLHNIETKRSRLGCENHSVNFKNLHLDLALKESDFCGIIKRLVFQTVLVYKSTI